MENIKIQIVEAQDCDALTDSQTEKLLELCCPQIKNRLERRKENKLKQGLAAQMALQYALYQGAGMVPGSYNILYTNQGKPYIENYPSLFISKTHSGSRGAAAIGGTPLGIDMEQLIPFRENFAGKICSQQEESFLKKAADKDSLMTQFFCCKEAFGKMTGNGLIGCQKTEIIPQKEGTFFCQGKNCFTWWEESYLFCLCTEETTWEKTNLSACQLAEWLGV